MRSRSTFLKAGLESLKIAGAPCIGVFFVGVADMIVKASNKSLKINPATVSTTKNKTSANLASFLPGLKNNPGLKY